MNQRLVSTRYPYIPIVITIRHLSASFDALLDTGFEGAVIVPASFTTTAGAPDAYARLRLADGSRVRRPAFLGTAELGQLGSFPVEIAALGDECLMGRELADQFTITLDHGQRIIVEP